MESGDDEKDDLVGAVPTYDPGLTAKEVNYSRIA